MTKCVRDKCNKLAEFFDLSKFEFDQQIANYCPKHANEISELLALIGETNKFLPIDINGLITVSSMEIDQLEA
jgi:hypothetical protein